MARRPPAVVTPSLPLSTALVRRGEAGAVAESEGLRQISVQRVGESDDAHRARLQELINSTFVESRETPGQIEVRVDALEEETYPSLRRIVVLLVLLFVVNMAFAFGFRALEFKQELRRARAIRVDVHAAFAADGEVLSKYRFTEALEALYDADMRCGECGREEDFAKICRSHQRHLRKCTWRLVGSFFFVMTAYTTIGYGTFTPTRYEAKILVVVAVVVGSSCAVPFYAAVGRRTAHAMARHPWCRANFAATMGVVGVAYLLLGAGLFHYLERIRADERAFTFWGSAYFSFITLSTVGFGGYAPSPSTPSYLAAWFYSIFGLGIISTAVSAVVSHRHTLVRKAVAEGTTKLRLLDRSRRGSSAPPRAPRGLTKKGGPFDDDGPGAEKKAASDDETTSPLSEENQEAETPPSDDHNENTTGGLVIRRATTRAREH